MKENNSKNPLKNLLDRLQEDSWQLELLVSGFTIFGLFSVLGPMGDALTKAQHERDILEDFYFIIYAAIFILILNLIIHLVLRSLWIGALGLRSVSGEVDIDKLNYSERFTKYLKKKIGSFDSYIEKLEKLCSVIFAISFLLIFYVAAIFIVQYFGRFIGVFFSDDAPTWLYILQETIGVFLLLGAFLTFIDYLTQGLLKKNKWIAKLYFPFYWVFSYLTLSFLYRPLFYNLIDNKFGRRISFLLLPFYISVLLIATIYKEQSGLIILRNATSDTITALNTNYEDLVEKDKLISFDLTIQSKVITDPYIKVKIPFSMVIENNLMDFNESLRSCQDANQYKSTMDINGLTVESAFKGDRDSLHLEILKTFQNVYKIKIDTVPYNPDFVIVNDRIDINLNISLETYIGTSNLKEGKHILVFYKPKHPKTDSTVIIREIPFWYFKE